MKTFCASAPGKILWLGGYSVLEKGRLAYVTAVDKRAYAKCEPLAGNQIAIDCPQFGLHLSGKMEGAKFKIGRADRKKKETGRFALAAVENSGRYLLAKGKRLSGLRITTTNDPAFGTAASKTGLGSSAASTVAIVAAILGAYGVEVVSEKGKIIINNISQLSHSQAQGKVGSGFDVAAAVFGSIKYSRYSPEIISKAQGAGGSAFFALIERPWDYTIAALSPPPEFQPVLAYTNVSASTSEMVRKVAAFKAKRRKIYEGIVAEIDFSVMECMQILEQLLQLRQSDIQEFRLQLYRRAPAFEQFRAHFNGARLLTKKLGELSGTPIEGSEFTRLIQKSYENGAFVCRLPGAGGGDAVAAICIDGISAAKLRRFWESLKLKVLDARFGETGAREEAPGTVEKMLKTKA